MVGRNGMVKIVGKFAIKTPLAAANERYRNGLHREAFLAQRIPKQPLVVQIFGFDAMNCRVEMEHVPGGTMASYLPSLGQLKYLTRAQRIPWALNILKGLKHLHKHGIMHGDFHKLNIMLDDNRNFQTIDFSDSLFKPGKLPRLGRATNGHKYPTFRARDIYEDLDNAGASLAAMLWEDAPAYGNDFDTLHDCYCNMKLGTLSGVLCVDILERISDGTIAPLRCIDERGFVRLSLWSQESSRIMTIKPRYVFSLAEM